MKVFAAAAVLFVLAFALIPSFRNRVTNDVKSAKGDLTRELCTKVVPFHAVRAVASSEAPGHPASNLINLNTATWWEAAPTDGSPGINIFFDRPTNINKLLFTNGAEDITSEPSARVVNVVQLDPTHTPIIGRPTAHYKLKDVATAQTVNFNAKQISGIYMQIVSTNRPGTGTNNISLNKVEFAQCA